MSSHKSYWGWAFALVGSVLLNVSLFGLMPGLIQGGPKMPDEMEELNQIQVYESNEPSPPPSQKKAGKTKRNKTGKNKGQSTPPEDEVTQANLKTPASL